MSNLDQNKNKNIQFWSKCISGHVTGQKRIYIFETVCVIQL